MCLEANLSRSYNIRMEGARLSCNPVHQVIHIPAYILEGRVDTMEIARRGGCFQFVVLSRGRMVIEIIYRPHAQTEGTIPCNSSGGQRGTDRSYPLNDQIVSYNYSPVHLVTILDDYL